MGAGWGYFNGRRKVGGKKMRGVIGGLKTIFDMQPGLERPGSTGGKPNKRWEEKQKRA